MQVCCPRGASPSASAAARTSTSTSIGEGWPAVETRQEMLEEAVEVIRALFARRSGHLPRRALRRSTASRVWDLPDEPVGDRHRGLRRPERRAVRAAGRPPHRGRAERRPRRPAGTASTAPPPSVRVPARSGRCPICWDPDEKAAVERAHEQFRWFGGGWNVNADLPTTAGFASASQFVTPDDVAESIPCGPDLDKIVEAVSEFWEAGFTDVCARAGRRRGPGPVPRAGGRAAAGEPSGRGPMSQSSDRLTVVHIRPDWDQVTDGCSGAALQEQATRNRCPMCGVERPPDLRLCQPRGVPRTVGSPRWASCARCVHARVSDAVVERSSPAAGPPSPPG